MNNKERLSALADGELSEEECLLCLQNLSSEDALAWAGYHLTGDLMRSSDLAANHQPDFLSRFAARLNEEPVVLVPQALKHVPVPPLGGAWPWRSMGQVAASVAAVAVFSVGLLQALPPVASEIQVVRSKSAQAVSQADLAQWEEYFQAHQQHTVRSGLSGVSPVVRAEISPEALVSQERMGSGQNEPGAWMNVWETSPEAAGSGRFQIQYVSSVR